ncbi:hypothetical protein SO802_016034 [Lithocarpus litseifolius]|uniref:DDE Tnp4 domain-containing protein n=1 Tax=Lithocarpus litseifolius TaxID=425828 RepID=A0AAW2CVC6_9ROSI
MDYDPRSHALICFSSDLTLSSDATGGEDSPDTMPNDVSKEMFLPGEKLPVVDMGTYTSHYKSSNNDEVEQQPFQLNALVPSQQNFKAANKMMDLLNNSSNSQHQDVDFEMSDDIVLATYLAGCAIVVAYVETYMNKVPMHTNIQTGYEWVQYILNGNEQKCLNVFRLSSHVFRQLYNTLRTQYGYDGTKRIFLKESVAMTLVVFGNGIGNRMVHARFQHSGETVHQHVATVVTLLATIMEVDIIKLADCTFCNVPSHIRSSERYWPHFKVLCEFGKYYLVDSGYPIKRGFLAPYKGERYHIPDFQPGEELHRPEEKFNYLYSSLRSVIERTFGVWKNATLSYTHSNSHHCCYKGSS